MTLPLLNATVILIAAWIAATSLRRSSADLRHLVWVAAMVSLAILPFVSLVPRSAIPSAIAISVPAMVTKAQVATPKLNWIWLCWAIGASVVVGRMLLGLIAAYRITRTARVVEGILYSDLAATPMTWGFLRPDVILPSYAMNWTADQRELVIRHERAHIERRDWLWQMLAQMASAVYWFHPLVWLANVQLRREAEAAVDDLVLAGGAAPYEYAERLLDVARRVQSCDAPLAVIPMVRRTELETRVRSVLDPARRRASAGFLARGAIALATVALTIPGTVAQDRVYHTGEGITPPSIIYKVEPQYTPEAHDQKIQGTVKLQVEITPAGTAENIHVVKSLDRGLDENAIFAVTNWKFKPGMKDGQSVTVAATIEVTFHLL